MEVKIPAKKTKWGQFRSFELGNFEILGFRRLKRFAREAMRQNLENKKAPLGAFRFSHL
jgi:hypothetical protein